MGTRIFTFAAFALVGALLSGCSSEPLAEGFGHEGGSYSSPDGRLTETAAQDRGDPVEFSGESESGSELSSSSYLGSVLVVNFWYAICAPCRAEAPDLERLHSQYEPSGVHFLGVNTEDRAETAQAFNREFAVTYPSILDAQTGKVRLAFAGTVGPATTPTTLVIDKKGRVFARILGQIDPSMLEALIQRALDE